MVDIYSRYSLRSFPLLTTLKGSNSTWEQTQSSSWDVKTNKKKKLSISCKKDKYLFTRLLYRPTLHTKMFKSAEHTTHKIETSFLNPSKFKEPKIISTTVRFSRKAIFFLHFSSKSTVEPDASTSKEIPKYLRKDLLKDEPKMTNILDQVDPELFRTYAFWSVILVLKMVLMTPLTVFNRFRKMVSFSWWILGDDSVLLKMKTMQAE